MRTKIQWTMDMDETLRRMHGDRATIKAIANAVGVGKTTAAHRMEALGLRPIRPKAPSDSRHRQQENIPTIEHMEAMKRKIRAARLARLRGSTS